LPIEVSVVDAAAVPPTIAASVASIASVASTPEPIVDHATPDPVPSQVPVIKHPPTVSLASTPCPIGVDASAVQPKEDGAMPSIQIKLRDLNTALEA
jgi:hypothetical protein